ncbi:MaoC family dehydratase [Pseudonocardia sp. WMMC193]|uniref:MaoC family dehydratase n=1 Tax=Pseudonocardia sp. WMMC193 TaxID=2911965 RepID=UPI001F21FB7A|nr:MaoC family dehydratase [Pseudonocardia sp. WMMC193]MCF7553276.1 MaoC family dehydratase [Pseudonocardia sp. WMMC193]
MIAFEDLTPGRVFDLGSVTVDRDEMIAFARRFDPQPFHLDEEAGRASVFGGLAASGWFTAGLWMRLYIDELVSKAEGLGSPGGDEIAWPAPVFAGDRLFASMEIVTARRSSSKPWMGLVTLRAWMRRGAADSDDVVYRARFTGMFGSREHPRP